MSATFEKDVVLDFASLIDYSLGGVVSKQVNMPKKLPMKLD